MFEPQLASTTSHKRVSSDSGSNLRSSKLPSQLRYLGMEWIMIKDDDTKSQRSHHKGSHQKGVRSLKFPSEKKLQIAPSLSQRDLSTSRTRFSGLNTGRSLFAEEMLNDARKILHKEKDLRANLGVNSELRLHHEQSLSPMSLETTSPMNRNEIHKLVRTLDNVSITSTDRIENSETARNELVRSLVKMMESNAEYENLVIRKGKNLVSTNGQRKKLNELWDDEEKNLKARRNGEMGFKSNPLMFFVSPTGLASASALDTKVDSHAIIQSDIRKEEKIQKRDENERAAMVFETGNNPMRGQTLPGGPETYLSDNLDYEVFLKAEKDRRKEISLPHEMKHLLEKFSSKPGKKVFDSPNITEEKIRAEVKLMKEATSQESSILPGHSCAVSPKQLKLPQLSARRRRKLNAVADDIHVAGADNREKSLAELLFERLKSKLPKIPEKQTLIGAGKNVHENRKQLIDNAFNRRKNYDAWYLSPTMRAQKLHTYLKSP